MNGGGGTTVQTAQLLKELEELWKGMASPGDESTASGVLRACAMTLIVIAGEDKNADDVNQTLGALMHEHPCRAISIRIEGKEGLAARVFAQCWLPFGRRQQICCEEIEITAGPASVPELPAVLRGLTVPDLPVVVWAATPALLETPGIAAVLELADETIFDSSAVEDGEAFVARRVAQAASRTPGHRIADLAWTRLTRWREAIAQAFETGDRAGAVRHVTIEHSTEWPALGTRYLGAWIRESLGRPIDCSFVHVNNPSPRAIDRVRFTGDGVAAMLARSAEGTLGVEVDSVRAQGLMPHFGDYDLLREELSVPGRDTIYENVLRRILQR